MGKLSEQQQARSGPQEHTTQPGVRPGAGDHCFASTAVSLLPVFLMCPCPYHCALAGAMVQ